MVNKVKLTDRQADSIAHVLAALATFMEAHKAALFIDPKGSPYLELPGLDEPVQIVVGLTGVLFLLYIGRFCWHNTMIGHYAHKF